MNLAEAYQRIWAGKLDGITPPDQQHIDRVRWTAELFGAATGPLLDVGCGSGAMLAEARRRGWEAFGLDLDPALVRWLVNSGYAAQVQSIDTERWNLSPGFGIVTACDVIEHLIDPDQMLAEAFRVLRPGGRLFVGTPNCSHWRRVVSLARGKMFRTSGDNCLRDGGHIGYWAPVDLTEALSAAGFIDIAVNPRSHDPCPDGAARPLRELGAGEYADWTYIIAEAVKP